MCWCFHNFLLLKKHTHLKELKNNAVELEYDELHSWHVWYSDLTLTRERETPSSLCIPVHACSYAVKSGPSQLVITHHTHMLKQVNKFHFNLS